MKETRPLSTFQYAIWTGQHLHPDIPLYNEAFTFAIYGSVDRPLFERAFRLLVDHSLNLQTVLEETIAFQPNRVRTTHQGEVEYIDGSMETDFDLDQWLMDRHSRILDLHKKSYDCALIKLSDQHYVWFLKQHHLVSDAYSNKVLFDKMSDLYATLSKNSAPPDFPITDDAPEFNRLVDRRDDSPERGDKPTTSPLSRNFTLYGEKFIRPRTTQSNRYTVDVSPARVDAILNRLDQLQLRTLSAGLDISTFLFSAFFILLSKISNRNELIPFSSLFSDRFTIKSQSTSGPILTLIDHDVAVGHATTITEVYRQIYDFVINRPRSDHRTDSGIPPILINFIALDFGEFAGMPVAVRWRHVNHMDEHHFIRFHIIRYTSSGGYTLAFDIKDGHPNSDLGSRLISDFNHLIDNFLLENWDTALHQICLLPEQELSLLKKNVARIYEKRIPKQEYLVNKILHHMNSRPDDVAIIDGDISMTYGQLKSASLTIARNIQSLGISHGSKIVTYLPRSANYICAIVGIACAQSCFVPVPKTYPIERLKYIIQDVGADLLISDDEQVTDDIAVQHIDDLMTGDAELEVQYITPEESLYILYTSGSTGKPKGVLIPQSALTNHMQNVAKRYIAEDRSYHMPVFTSVGFDLTMTAVFLPLYSGGCIHIYGESGQIDTTIREVIQNEEINCLTCTSSHMKLTSDLSINAHIETILFAGEKLTRQAALDVFERCTGPTTLYNEYGPTESTVGCLIHPFDPSTYQDLSIVPIGKPMDNHFVFIADENGTPLPQGVIGELCLGGLGLADCYWADAEKTEQKFISDNEFIPGRYYRTGDFARQNSKGDFEFIGRQDNQVKISGIRIEIGEIEQVITGIDGVDSCRVRQLFLDQLESPKTENDISQNSILVAFYLGEKSLASDLRSAVARYLPYYMVPAQFIHLEEYPMTANGKIDFKQLERLPFQQQKEHRQPSNEIEEILFSIWQEIMGSRVRGIDDDFFELGGSSLDAIKIVSRIEKLINYKLSVHYIFELPTIQYLSDHILTDMQTIIEDSQHEN